MSLRTRLSLLTVGLLLALLVAGGIFQYFALGQYLFRDEAQVLQQRYTQAIRELAVRGRACTAAGQLASGAALGVGARVVPPVVGGHITTSAADDESVFAQVHGFASRGSPVGRPGDQTRSRR